MPEPIRITRALDAERLAQPIMEEHHKHLAGCRILFLYTNKQRVKGMKVVLASAQKTNPMIKYLTSALDGAIVGKPTIEDGYDFLILIDEGEWVELSEDQRLALLDHELMHCFVDEDGSYKIRGHDVEEFSDIIARHGLWKSDVKTMGEVIRQMRLDEAVPVGARR